MSVDLFVLGCSHAGRLIKGAELIGLDAAGGALMRGRLWDEGRFDWSDVGGLEIHDEIATARLAAGLEAAGVERIEDLKAPIVTTLGYQFDILLDDLARGWTLAHDPSEGRDFLARDVFDAYVRERRAKLLDLIAWLTSRGNTVVVVEPPRRHFATEFVLAFEQVMAESMAARGAVVCSTRGWSTDKRGLLRPEFASPREDDRVHGNSFFGARAMDQVARMLGLTPSVDRAVLADAAAFEAHALSLRRSDVAVTEAD